MSKIKIISKYKNGNTKVTLQILDDGTEIRREHYCFRSGLKKLRASKNNVQHNEHGPALVDYDKDGNIIKEVYYCNGIEHRTDGPSCTEYDMWGNLYRQRYKVNGKFHRIDGVADYVNSWYRQRQDYYLNGEWVNEQEHFIQMPIKLKLNKFFVLDDN